MGIVDRILGYIAYAALAWEYARDLVRENPGLFLAFWFLSFLVAAWI